MRVSTVLLPLASAVTASYIFKNSHLRFICSLVVPRNKTLSNLSSTYYVHHTDLIIVVYKVFDWIISTAIFHFLKSILFLKVLRSRYVRNLINRYLKAVH